MVSNRSRRISPSKKTPFLRTLAKLEVIWDLQSENEETNKWGMNKKKKQPKNAENNRRESKSEEVNIVPEDAL